MKKFILGVFSGVAISTFVFVPIEIRERRDKFDFGRKAGIVEGLIDAAHSLDQEFGHYDGHTPYKVLFSVKTTDVISTETNGVKTLFFIPEFSLPAEETEFGNEAPAPKF